MASISKISLAILLGLLMSACSKVGFSSASPESVKGKSVFTNDGNGRRINLGGLITDGDDEERPTQMPAPCNFLAMEGGTCGSQTPENKRPRIYNLEEPNNPRIIQSCTNRRHDVGEVSLKFAMAHNLKIELIVNGQVCSSNTTAVVNTIRSNEISEDNIKTLCPSLISEDATQVDVRFYVNGKVFDRSAGSKDEIEVFWARGQGTQGKGLVDEADAECEEFHSPLVIRVASDRNNPAPASISLSSQENGVMFDLLGAANNHNKVQISWFTNTDYRLLALPDASGQVTGIDQLFGNNTVGPDNRMSSDGYAALGKHDLNRDNMIDRRDAVFSKLRVWADKNFDGISDAGELSSLASVGIIYIDLNYSSDYEETDQWGNQTRMKSVVGFSDGTLDLIFDLWFKL